MPVSRPAWHAVEVAVRSFSTSSRPALRAASGRPPARQPHDGHRGAGLTLHPSQYTARRAELALLRQPNCTGITGFKLPFAHRSSGRTS
jgi:hypothetical protein